MCCILRRAREVSSGERATRINRTYIFVSPCAFSSSRGFGYRCFMLLLGHPDFRFSLLFPLAITPSLRSQPFDALGGGCDISRLPWPRAPFPCFSLSSLLLGCHCFLFTTLKLLAYLLERLQVRQGRQKQCMNTKHTTCTNQDKKHQKIQKNQSKEGCVRRIS